MASRFIKICRSFSTYPNFLLKNPPEVIPEPRPESYYLKQILVELRKQTKISQETNSAIELLKSGSNSRKSKAVTTVTVSGGLATIAAVYVNHAYYRTSDAKDAEEVLKVLNRNLLAILALNGTVFQIRDNQIEIFRNILAATNSGTGAPGVSGMAMLCRILQDPQLMKMESKTLGSFCAEETKKAESSSSDSDSEKTSAVPLKNENVKSKVQSRSEDSSDDSNCEDEARVKASAKNAPAPAAAQKKQVSSDDSSDESDSVEPVAKKPAPAASTGKKQESSDDSSEVAKAAAKPELQRGT